MLGVMREPIPFLQGLARTYGDVSRFRLLGYQGIYFVNHPDLIHEVLVARAKDYRKGQGLQEAKRLLGEGLLTSEGELHKRQRRFLQPIFQHQRIAGYAEQMVQHAARARERWHAGQAYDVKDEMQRLTLGIVAQTLFDADVEEEAEDIGRALTTSLLSLNRARSPLRALENRLPTPSQLRFRRARLQLDAIVYRMIAERRGSPKDRSDLLTLLLQATDPEGSGGGMSDAQVRDEALTLFLAGHETTALALTWTWYLLSLNPDPEARLHAELDAVLQGKLPTAADVPRLPYTRKVLQESMRLYPPAWALTRQALADTPLGPYTVRKGDTVFMSMFVTHRDPRWWPEPERFEPDRWTPEAEAKRPRYAYFPFGGGPRVCIGEGFAWMEGVLLLATVAQRWSFRLVPGHPIVLQPLITLRPRHGMRMTAHAR
jgi:cytochrome P450